MSRKFQKPVPGNRNTFECRSLMLEKMAQSPVGLCNTLKSTIPHGVAYHHAGLTYEERKIIEEGFRQGHISILCTTSTLAAGVNLPANRVIIRTPKLGFNYLNVASFRQMCGRAGRTGLDTIGEAVLMVAKDDQEEIRNAYRILTSDLEPLQSTLHHASGGGLEKLLLELISCKRLERETEVSKFIECTLMNAQLSEEHVKEHTKTALTFLIKEQFILYTKGGSFTPSQLGRATCLSGIAPRDAVHVLKPLFKARSKLILKGGLHCVFLITPPSTPIEPDWENYSKVLDALYKDHPDAEVVAEYIGVNHATVSSFTLKPPYRRNDSTIQFYKRFFSAILLFALIEEWALVRVTNITKRVTRGQLQQLQKDAAMFCGMMVVFCTNLNWDGLARYWFLIELILFSTIE